MKAREWLQRLREAGDPIDGFSNAWCAFNHLYFPVDGQNERDKIRQYLEGAVDENVAARLIADYRYEASYLLADPVIDMRGNGRNTARNIEAFQHGETALAKVKELFMIIYQIRCNLEHGQKSPSRERDVELCRAACPLVDLVVDANA
jgi:hypothetical protein